MLLQVKSVSKKYKTSSRKILENIDFTADNNDFVVLTGSSGSGKSTLLAIVGGYLQTESGAVVFEGNDLQSMEDKKLSELHNGCIGYVPQSNVMIKGYTVFENVIIPYGFSHKKEKQKDIEKRANELFSALNIDELKGRYPYELSGGELKRVAIVRALLSSPKLLLADEPTTGLDKENAQNITDFLVNYSKEGNVVVVATHDENVLKYGTKRLNLTKS